MTRRYLHLALPSPLRQTFDYVLPARMALPPDGARVRVPFGRQEQIGICLGSSETTSIPEDKLRAATECLDEEPALPPALFRLCLWAAEYYQHPLGEVFDTALPVLLRQGEPVPAQGELRWRMTRLGELFPLDGPIRRAPRQIEALLKLREFPEGMIPPLLASLGIERPTLLAMEKKGLVECITLTPPTHETHVQGLREPPLPLNPAQALAVDAVNARAGQFHPFLLFGITGSGKTEVYLQAIAAVLARGDQALVLVPEIGLAPQTVARFRARFQAEIAVLHSGRNERERLDAWRAARSGRAGIVIGTRSAVFTPLARPGLIIVDEEHDLSFKQQEGFRYHARDLAVRRAQLENVPVLLGSATPALESLHNAREGRYELLELNIRAANATLPLFKLIDLRHQAMKEGFSEPLLQAIRATLAKGEQVLVFINRRGFAPVLMCHDCGWQAQCKRCDARPTVHRNPARLHCHHCGGETRPPVQCPSCGSTDLRGVGLGTERAEDFLQRAFPKVPLFRVDRDSTRRKEALNQLYHDIHAAEAGILVGTQMLAKGHHFPRVTLVALLDIDGGLFGADFRSAEHIAQLIIQVAGRAGRVGRQGLVLLQTRQPEHPLLRELIANGYAAFAERVLDERRALDLPPCGYLALLRAEAPDAERPMAFLNAVAALVEGDALQLWGPVPAPMEKRAGRFRAHLLLQGRRRPTLHAGLAALLPRIEALPEARRVRWSLDVDPQQIT
ncbi:MAG: primosomal protein [Moraxellaceae bacterium]|jgi:primosomal protein N' (replication factor Y)|nr:primosomal protein [Moraxellaceae bacterium]